MAAMVGKAPRNWYAPFAGRVKFLVMRQMAGNSIANRLRLVQHGVMPIALDAVDLRLLALLQQDCARANQDLAEAVGISPATALRRVRRLVDAGVIERQVALVDPAAVDGLSVLAEVTLDRQGAEHVAAFEARAVAEPAVQQCYRVSPGPDLVLMLWLSGMADYHALVQRLFTQDANVRNVKSYFITHRAKFDPALRWPAQG